MAGVGDRGRAYRVLVGRPEGKRPRGRPSRRWVGGVWTGLIWLSIWTSGGRFVSAMMIFPVTYEGWNFNSGNYLFTTDTK